MTVFDNPANAMYLSEHDPVLGHRCTKIAESFQPDSGREIWLGKLIEPIAGEPQETHCLHITTPYKKVVFGINSADLLVYAVFAHLVYGKPINPAWLDRMAEKYQQKATGEVE